MTPTPTPPAARIAELTARERYELEQLHLGWLHNPNTSRGQLEDSKTVLNLLSHITALQAERDQARNDARALDEAACQLAAEVEHYKRIVSERTDEIHDYSEGWKELTGERDRLRAALEKIKLLAYGTRTLLTILNTARAALSGDAGQGGL